MDDIYKALLNITTEGIVIHDNGIIVEANAPFVKLFDYNSLVEIIGKNFFKLHFSIDSQKRLKEHFHEYKSAYELEIITAKKRIIPVSIKAETIDYQQRKVRVAVIKDITNKKEAEEKLQDSRLSYKLQYENNINPIASFRYDGERLILVDGNKAYFEYSKEDTFYGKSVDELFVNTERKEIKDALYNAYLKKSSFKFKTKVKSIVYNQDMHFNISISYIPPDGVNLMFQDITNEVELLEKKRASDEQFKFIFNQSPISIVNYSVGGEVLKANQKALELFGIEKIENLNDYNLFNDPNINKVTKERLLEGETFETEVHYNFEEIKRKKILPTSKSGRIILRASFAPVKINSGEITGYNSQLIDITKEYLAHKKIVELKEALEEENNYLKTEIRTVKNFENIITQNNSLLGILGGIEKIGFSDAPVLISGETGTGKELIARAIHNLSDRSEHALISVNCATIPDPLFESELFGHEKGAFTGAIAQKKGKFELANNGTLFLDEIGEIPISMQPKLLRSIQESCIERIGGTKTIKLNIRIICATNRDLEKEIKKGTFRSDLFYRLNVYPINLPPLRERREDIPLLVDFFINRYNKKYKLSIKKVSKKTIAELRAYSWPGNIRELENIIERAVITSTKGDLNISYMLPTCTNAREKIYNLSKLEREHIINALNKTAWRIAGKGGAAELLGLPRSTLQSRMLKLNIHKEDKVNF